MKLAWTKSSAPLSHLIRWGLKEDCSHFIIIFDDFLAFHSNLLGVHLDCWPVLKNKITVVHEIDIPLPLEVEEQIYKALIPRYIGSDYDIKAFLGFAWCAVKWRLFNTPMPTEAVANDPTKYLCTELAKALIEVALIQEPQASLAITSPHKLFYEISIQQRAIKN